jgi:hypothetical protein
MRPISEVIIKKRITLPPALAAHLQLERCTVRVWIEECEADGPSSAFPNGAHSLYACLASAINAAEAVDLQIPRLGALRSFALLILEHWDIAASALPCPQRLAAVEITAKHSAANLTSGVVVYREWP